MKFKIYSGEKTKNESINITYHGYFEAESKEEAIKTIEHNKKYNNCESWNFPRTNKYIPALINNFRWNLFVCDSDPMLNNVIWKDKKAVINYFEPLKNK